MKRTIVVLLTICFAMSLPSFSQDILFKKDGSKEEVKVQEINSKEISFKKYSNLDGPTFVVEREEVVLITFENGDHELITPVMAAPKEKEKPFTKDYEKNILAFHLFDVIFGDFAFSYERIVADGRLGIKVPVAFGFYAFDTYNTPFNFNNIFYTGMGINFYPTGQGKWRYFVGPNFRVGVGRSGEYMYYYDDLGNYYYDEYYETDSFYMKYYVDNGVTFMPIRNLSLSAIFSLGVRFIANPSYYYNRIQPDGQFAINMGLRF